MRPAIPLHEAVDALEEVLDFVPSLRIAQVVLQVLFGEVDRAFLSFDTYFIPMSRLSVNLLEYRIRRPS